MTTTNQPVKRSVNARLGARGVDSGSLIAGGMLVALFIAGMITVGGFTSGLNIRSMLLFGAFLGFASVGQTVCAVAGSLDLSIPFVIGAANVVSLWLMGKGFSSGIAILVVLAGASVFGAITGLICVTQHEKGLLVSLGMGFALLGAAQIVVATGSIEAGTVYGTVPTWLVSATSVASRSFGLPAAPAVVVWLLGGAGIIFLLRRTYLGRALYAMGGNPVAAKRILIPSVRVWVLTFSASAMLAAATGVLLLGFGGGAFADVGQQYLFTTVAAVVIGGTSLLGGRGGYGKTMIGVAVLTVLNTLLVGVGLSTPGQQAVLGLIIVPTVALYGREPHPRTQI